MRPGPLAPQERPRKKYTARSYSRSTLRPPKRYRASTPSTAVITMSTGVLLQAGKASTITAAPCPPPLQAEPRPQRCLPPRSRRPVPDPRRGARGDEPILLEVRLEGEQHLERRVGPHVLVGPILGRLSLPALHGHRYHLAQIGRAPV